MPLCRILPDFAPILIKSEDELSKCSLKYEPSVFNINTNVKDGITPTLGRQLGSGISSINLQKCNSLMEIGYDIDMNFVENRYVKIMLFITVIFIRYK